MIKKYFLRLIFGVSLLGVFLCLCFVGKALCEESLNNKKMISVEEFIILATENDTAFEKILLERLKLSYQKDLNLPAKDIVLALKSQYSLFLDQDREDPDMSVSLSKLFPYAGTDVFVAYKNSPSSSVDTMNSEFNFAISQPIAENAFGSATRLKDEIIGLEVDVIEYQVIEAYEDYLATLINSYYTWYSAYENLKIGQASYDQNLKVLENMQRRGKNKIALPVDINKVKLLVLAKKENIVTLEETYKNGQNFIKKAIRYNGYEELIPVDPSAFHSFDVEFEKDYQTFVHKSRTYQLLGLLEEKSTLEVKKSADDLLPSTNLIFGYEVVGEEWQVKNENNLVYAGVSVEWPFTDQVEKAEWETSKIDLKEIQLANENKYLDLYVSLRNLYLQIQKEKKLIEISKEKIALSEAILEDETRNYSFGKISLNDYISAVNTVDGNRFNKIVYTIQLKKLLLEWLRLTDMLVDEKDIILKPFPLDPAQ